MDNLWIWLVVEPYPSEKYEFVNRDDDIPNIWENKSHVPNHQPGNSCFLAQWDGSNGALFNSGDS